MSENKVSPDQKGEARKLLTKLKDLNSLEDDTRISRDERSAINFASDANWDMLKTMRCGVHNKQKFDCLGVEIHLRLLSRGEKIGILEGLAKELLIPNTNGIWEMEYVSRTLCLASTKHPTMIDDPILSRETLNGMPDFLIDELSYAYIDFVKTMNIPIDSLTEEQVKEYINILEKKPQVLSDLPYLHKEQIMSFLIKHYLTLLQQTNNLATQS